MTGRRSVLILAGGTGGHVFPALAVAEGLRERGWAVDWLGSRTGIESGIVPGKGLRLHPVAVSGLRGKGAGRRLLGPLMILWALLHSLALIARLRPVVVLGMGGFVAGPAGVAAWILRRPLLIHEQNACAGLTNRWLAPLARVVMEGFPGSFPARTRRRVRAGVRTTGNPVRPEIAALPEPRRRLGARAQAGGPLRLFVLGGSQGAEALNRLVPAVVCVLGDGVVDVRHQAGAAQLERTRASYRALERARNRVEVEAFYPDVAEVYGWADVVLSRAGAMTVSELAAAGVAALLFPYPHAVDDHQTRNARYLVDAGAAVLVAVGEATPERVAAWLARMHRDRGALLAMAERARSRAIPDALERVITCCEEVAHGAA